VTLVLSGSNTFSNGSNTVTLAGLRTTANIQSMQYPAFPQADVEIFGMLAADMNTLTDFENHQLAVTRNSMVVEANAGGDAGWTTVFAGQLVAAIPLYQSAPDVAMHLKGRVLGYESIALANPSSFTGATAVSSIVQQLAQQMGATFENDGVQGTLANPYLPGTAADQLSQVAQAANLGVYYDYGPASSGSNVPPLLLIITPKGLARNIPVVSLTPQTGLVDYPTIDSRGWIFARSQFNPALKFGGTVSISGSDIPRANATWQILQCTHLVDAVKPDGAWFTDMQLMPTGAYPYPQ